MLSQVIRYNKRATFLVSRRIYHKSSTNTHNNIQLNKESSKLSLKLKALENLTTKVKNSINERKNEEKRQEVLETSSIDENSEVSERDIDELFQNLGLGPLKSKDDTLQISSKSSSNVNTIEPSTKAVDKPGSNDSSKAVDLTSDLTNLFPAPQPYINLPSSITDILTPDVLSNITQPETADWIPIIDSLIEANFDVGHQISNYDFHTLIMSIPRSEKVKNNGKIVEKLHRLALINGLMGNENVQILNDIIASCNFLPIAKASALINTLKKDIVFNKEELVDEKKLLGNVQTKTNLLVHSARATDLESVRQYISELNKLPDSKNPMKTTPIIYTSIMQMYMRLENYSLAKQTFDTMKFLSLSTSPSPRTYTSMILLDSINNNIEHGISVYEEMLEKNIKPEPEALLALAKGCGSRKAMINEGWNFIIKYYEEGYPVDSNVMEIMLYLSHVDCDLSLVRGIWMNICETNTKISGEVQLPHPRCTKWLFNSYYRIGDNDGNTNTHQPVSVVDPRVRSIRSKILELTNFSFNSDGNGLPPFIPILEFNNVKNNELILNECKALWKYMLDCHPHMINDTLVEAYLYTVGRYDTLANFEREWKSLTIPDESINANGSVIIEEPEEEAMDGNSSEKAVTESGESSLYHNFGRVTRNDRLYNMCMHVARHQNSLSFAQKIWEERGKFRKSEQFQKLGAKKQDEADFKFARLMVSVLTHLGNVGDAYKLVLSSQNRFVWTKYHLKSLLSLCERLGYVSFSKELQKVIRRGDKWTRRRNNNTN